VSRPVSIRSRLTRNILLVIVLLGASTLALTFVGSSRTTATLSRALIERVADQTEARLKGYFEPVVRQLEIAVRWKQKALLAKDDPRTINDLFQPILRKHPQISSVLLADTRGREHMLLHEGTSWRNRRTRRDDWGDTVRWREWSDEAPAPTEREETTDYDPRRRPWFEGAMTRAPSAPLHWTAPYRFATTQEPGITASIALPEEGGVRHVLGFDILLSDISRFTTGPDARVSEHGFVFVLDASSSEVLGLPGLPRFEDEANRRAAIDRTVQEIDEPLLTAAAGAAPANAGSYRFEAEGVRWWGGVRRYALAADRVLRIVVVLPESDVLGELPLLRWLILGITLLAVGLAAWRAYVLADRFSGPIEALVAGSERIRQGDLQRGTPIRSDLIEVQRLADSQERMRSGLKALMKLERDLQVARQIQQKTFPDVLPGLRDFDVEAWSEPADETGGDTYDVIGLTGAWQHASLIASEEGAHRAMLMLADATGHGIGPALSAMQLRAMLRMAVRLGADLQTMARHMNDQLCQDLPSARFLTTWFGQLDPEHHTLRTFSAGQAPLLHYHAAADTFDVLLADSPPLGILRDIRIEIGPPLAMAPGDLYLVFSDGIYEAMDPDGARFGEDRVQRIVREHRERPPKEILEAVRSELVTFARGRPADDDRTAIIIKRL